MQSSGLATAPWDQSNKWIGIIRACYLCTQRCNKLPGRPFRAQPKPLAEFRLGLMKLNTV